MTIGNSSPAAKPCARRPATSTQNAGAKPHRIEAAVKTLKPRSQTRFSVKRFST